MTSAVHMTSWSQNVWTKVQALLLPGQVATKSWDALFGFQQRPSKPEFFLEPRQEFLNQLEDQLHSKRKVLLMGRSGSGKTTVALEMQRRMALYGTKTT